MSILIDGMGMPKEGSWTTVRIYPDGTCAVPNWQGDCTLIKGAKAIPVPPHGRLIDADALLNRDADYEYPLFDTDGSWDCVVPCYDRETIKSAHTIIPAEPPKGETDG